MSQDPTPPLSAQSLKQLAQIPLDAVSSPGYVVHLDRLEENCQLLASVAERSGAKVLLALKGFACHATFPLIRQYLQGTTSSGLHEALLAKEYFGKEVHVYCPAYKSEELAELGSFAHSLVFNSPRQLEAGLKSLQKKSRPEIGLRINPEYSEVETDLYDPCAPDSRLGTPRSALDTVLTENPDAFEALDGLHFHALCEQDADALEHTVAAFEAKFSDLIARVKWVNFGGGHHITRPGYDVERLISVIRRFRESYQVEIYLEPGEAVALHTGILVVTVLDILEAGGHQLAILDSSATCHMPDVLEMPYRPNIAGAGKPGENEYTYRLGGLSCLAGDVIGDYSFEEPLRVGQRLAFLDMSHYTMVKTTTFNGVPLPSINTYSQAAGLTGIRQFGYADYRDRLS
ncbi:carboxynorspermidine decarboxylase [Coraliomargarita sinensis]|uniref:Carboxynorspermidine/carboxyspermidine decarboxylase n=1 Tax=Coraliomargarita sinensis TaxID=2174842 RepID=A0A317ZL95_9BACT|nr:carboxynorspermidine decarboxylase [Coraliomargarita sinensis]PXA04718.1 carboxynorspermidine decarboxylase [Coraliomargarita sinensis]